MNKTCNVSDFFIPDSRIMQRDLFVETMDSFQYVAIIQFLLSTWYLLAIGFTVLLLFLGNKSGIIFQLVYI